MLRPPPDEIAERTTRGAAAVSGGGLEQRQVGVPNQRRLRDEHVDRRHSRGRQRERSLQRRPRVLAPGEVATEAIGGV